MSDILPYAIAAYAAVTLPLQLRDLVRAVRDARSARVTR